MNIYDVRRINLRRLIGSERGALVGLAVKAKISKQQVSHIIGERPIKNIGDEQARKLEAALGEPLGALDINHEQPVPETPAGQFDVPLLERVCGLGENPRAPAQSLRLTREWITKNMGIAPEHAAVTVMAGDAMAPTLLDGDVLLADRKFSSVDREGIYVFARGTDIYVRRASRKLNGGLLLSADNQAYPPQEVKNAVKEGLLTLGRVLMTLRPNRL